MSTSKRITRSNSGLLDFHTHSTYSDGTRTPKELVNDAKRYGISALALTDHHTASGLEEFVSECKKNNIFYILFGIEIFAELPSEVLTGKDNEAPDLILLGKKARTSPLYDYQELLLKDLQERVIPETINGLELVGLKINPVDLRKHYKKSKIGLQAHSKIFHNILHFDDNLEVFVDYISNTALEADMNGLREYIKRKPLTYLNKYLFSIGCPAYSKRIKGFDVKKVIHLADSMNCAIFIAHPGGEYGCLSDEILSYYIKMGIKGIEVRNYFNTLKQNAKFDSLAKRYNLLRSGGSDYHGPTKVFKIGSHDKLQNQLPQEILEELWHSLPN